MDLFMLKYKYWYNLEEEILIKLAWLIPRKLALWTFVRVASASGKSPHELTYESMYDDWEKGAER